MSDQWLLVGLGNPGQKYARTRHNVGHMVVDVVAQRLGTTLKRHRAGAHVGSGVVASSCRLLVATLDTYMNTSGGPTRALVDYYGIDPTRRLIVVHDDLDLDAHRLRLKCGGGEGGHNGLKSISGALGTRDYLRVRVGIGRPPGRMDPADYVLGVLPRGEREEWAVTFAEAADAVADLISDGLTAAQQKWHSRS